MRNTVFEDVHNCVVKNWQLFIYGKISKNFLNQSIL